MERRTVRVAQIQMSVTADKAANLCHAAELIRSAGEVNIAVLPEMFCCPYDNACFREYAEEECGEVWRWMASLAKERGIYLVGGSIPELCEGKVYNTCYVFSPEGCCVARHRKTHLFDISVEGGQHFMESETLSAGRDVTLFDTPWGKMGVCICFDFRFAELSRLLTLEGAQVIFVPAAFNMTTGPAHWELLFRQRAVDNQLFTVGTSPARDEKASYVAWGHSIICDPWGTVLTEADEKERIVVTELDMTRIAKVRKQLPILSARRTDLYDVEKR